VGASDSGTEGIFVWCSLDTPSNVSQFLKWQNGEPNNFKNDEDCASVSCSSGKPPDNILLNDIPCTAAKKNYLCEVRQIKSLISARLIFVFAVKRIRCLHRAEMPKPDLRQRGF
jgi:hypothetical protein